MFARSARLALALGLLARLAAAQAAPVVSQDQEMVRRAIESAVVSRVGQAASVEVTVVSDVRLGDTGGPIVATPDQGARAGQPARFTLFAGGVARHIRVGEATAIVVLTAATVRTRHAVARGQLLENADVESLRATLDEVRFVRLPLLADVVGARATRDLPVDLVLSVGDFAAEPAVRAGASVQGLVRVSGVEIAATMVALQSGVVDDVIPVMNTATRRTVRGRITGRGEIEVLDVR